MDSFFEALVSGNTGRVLDEEASYWIFSEITGGSFRWEYIMIKAGGSKILVCEIVGRRIAEKQGLSRRAQVW